MNSYGNHLYEETPLVFNTANNLRLIGITKFLLIVTQIHTYVSTVFVINK